MSRSLVGSSSTSTFGSAISSRSSCSRRRSPPERSPTGVHCRLAANPNRSARVDAEISWLPIRAMRETSEQLRTETGQLVTALRSSQVRGRWGELQLRRVVEAAGMLEHVDFVEQAGARTDDGLLRPDMIVRLSGGKSIVLDAKVAFLGYLDAV